MKVISILQPWATLVVIGAKKIETRSWATKYRGPILIHASQKVIKPKSWHPDLLDHFIKASNLRASELPYGAIIGQVNLDTIQPTLTMRSHPLLCLERHPILSEQEYAFGDYSINRYGWLLSNPIQFKEPIPAKGQLGIWEYSDIENLKEVVNG